MNQNAVLCGSLQIPFARLIDTDTRALYTAKHERNRTLYVVVPVGEAVFRGFTIDQVVHKQKDPALGQAEVTRTLGTPKIPKIPRISLIEVTKMPNLFHLSTDHGCFGRSFRTTQDSHDKNSSGPMPRYTEKLLIGCPDTRSRHFLGGLDTQAGSLRSARPERGESESVCRRTAARRPARGRAARGPHTSLFSSRSISRLRSTPGEVL